LAQGVAVTQSKATILFVDWWKGGFLRTVFDLGRKEIEMFHALGVHISDPHDATDMHNGWVVPNNGSAGVWERRFQAFLNATNALRQVLSHLYKSERSQTSYGRCRQGNVQVSAGQK
jgi:hypothetical protein